MFKCGEITIGLSDPPTTALWSLWIEVAPSANVTPICKLMPFVLEPATQSSIPLSKLHNPKIPNLLWEGKRFVSIRFETSDRVQHPV